MRSMMAIAAFMALAPYAAAQQQSIRPHPADPAATPPAAKYESALTGYRGFREEPLAPWRDVNEEVARTGGHVGIMRGADAHKPPAAAPARPAQK